MDIDGLVKAGYTQKVPPSRELADKELHEAEYDLGHAESELREEDYKWAIVKSYYAVFHSARDINA